MSGTWLLRGIEYHLEGKHELVYKMIIDMRENLDYKIANYLFCLIALLLITSIPSQVSIVVITFS